MKKHREIVIATRNRKKLAEIREIMKDADLKFLTLNDFPKAPHVRENGKTFFENAAKKPLTAPRISTRPSLSPKKIERRSALANCRANKDPVPFCKFSGGGGDRNTCGIIDNNIYVGLSDITS